MPDMFEEFWAAIPKRNKPHPKMDARVKWDRAIREGAKPEEIIHAARAWRKAEEENGTAGTKFVPHASTWLHQKRFLDYKIEAVNYAKCDDIAAKSGYKWVGTETDGKYVKLGGEENGDTGIHDI